MTLAGAEIGEYMESMEMRPALPESNGFPAAAANSWYSPPGSAGEKVKGVKSGTKQSVNMALR